MAGYPFRFNYFWTLFPGGNFSSLLLVTPLASTLPWWGNLFFTPKECDGEVEGETKNKQAPLRGTTAQESERNTSEIQPPQAIGLEGLILCVCFFAPSDKHGCQMPRPNILPYFPALPGGKYVSVDVCVSGEKVRHSSALPPHRFHLDCTPASVSFHSQLILAAPNPASRLADRKERIFQRFNPQHKIPSSRRHKIMLANVSVGNRKTLWSFLFPVSSLFFLCCSRCTVQQCTKSFVARVRRTGAHW